MIGKTVTLVTALLLIGSLGLAFSSTRPVDLGNTQEPFWAGLREAQAKHAPNWGEAFAVRLNIFTEREALDALAQRYLSVAGPRAVSGVGWPSLGLIPEPYTEALVIGLSRVPILDEPKLLSNHLKVYGLAHEGDIFPIVGGEQITVKGLSMGVGPMDAGEWVKILTKTGARGWVRREGSARRVVLRMPQTPAPPLNIDSSPVQSSQAISRPLIVLAGFLFMLIVLWWLLASRTRPYLISSEVSDHLSERLHSNLDEFAAFGDGEENGEEGWFSNLFKSRTSSMPKQRWFESNRDYRDSLYLKGKERILEDITGSEPKRGWFEAEEGYRSRIAHEANERVVEEATGSEPKRGWLESEEDYRSRIAQEVNEHIVEGATGDVPKRGWFENEEEFRTRIAQEANEHIVEEATGYAPKRGWFESDEEYHARINREASEIRASRRE
jgi:hypothetical protein